MSYFCTNSLYISYNLLNHQRINLVMRVYCPCCEHKAVITSNNKFSNEVKDLYAKCLSPLCGAGFKMTLAVAGIIQPPINQTNSLLAELLTKMPQKERQEICSQAGLVLN